MAELLTESRLSRARTALRLAAVGLFIAVIPLFLISTNVRLIVNWPWLYSNGFDKYDIPSRTGIERAELISAGEQIRDYFNNDDELIDVRIFVGGILRSLFNNREILHMKDVKGLVQGVYTVQVLTGLYIAAFVIAGLALDWRGFGRRLTRYLEYGGLLTIGLVVLAGVGVAGGLRAGLLRVPRDQLHQRPVAARPEPRLPDRDLPRGLLLRRHHVDRGPHHSPGRHPHHTRGPPETTRGNPPQTSLTRLPPRCGPAGFEAW